MLKLDFRNAFSRWVKMLAAVGEMPPEPFLLVHSAYIQHTGFLLHRKEEHAVC